MGHTVKAKCLDCGNEFTVSHDGGFFFHLLRCNKCGKTKSVNFRDLGELHLQYLKGLPGPYCVASSEHDKYVREHSSVEPISENEYHKKVEAFAGKCKCNGKYCFDAPPRCPKCHSKQIAENEDDILTFYD